MGKKGKRREMGANLCCVVAVATSSDVCILWGIEYGELLYLDVSRRMKKRRMRGSFLDCVLYKDAAVACNAHPSPKTSCLFSLGRFVAVVGCTFWSAQPRGQVYLCRPNHGKQILNCPRKS